MGMAEITDDQLAQAALIEEMQVDGQRTKFRSVDDLLKLQAALAARNRRRAPFYTIKASPPGMQE